MNANILVETEGLSHDEWLKWRRQGIGGSDVAAILGISSWNSAIDIWLDKTGQKQGTEETTNEAMEWGTILEPVIRTHFANTTGKPVSEVHAILQHPQYPFMLADLDGVTIDDNGDPSILEIKTVSEYKRSEWEQGVPVYYQTQVQHYLAVTGLSLAYVAALIGGNSFRTYKVEADPDIQRMLISLEKDFWGKVERRIRPAIDGSDTSAKFLDSLYSGGDTEELVLPSEAETWIDEYMKSTEEEDEAKTKKQEAVNHLKELMADHETAVCGNHKISWKSVSSERFDSKALQKEEPELYTKFVKTSSFRRFTVR